MRVLCCLWAAMSWVYEAHAFVPHKAPIVVGTYATLAACERARDQELERDPDGPYRCLNTFKGD